MGDSKFLKVKSLNLKSDGVVKLLQGTGVTSRSQYL